MKKLFIGIDVSKDVFDYCCLDQENQIVLRGKADNTKQGIKKFCKLINALKGYSLWICMEHTGYYDSLLAFEFAKKKLCYSLLNPLELKRSMGITRGKNDRIDAYRIASYALSNSHKLQPYILPAEELRVMKVLMSSRDRLTKVSVQLQNGLQGLRVVSRTMNLKKHIEENKAIIKQMKVRIKDVEKQILEIIKSTPELKENYDKIEKVIGVGKITATKCIIETNNFTKFTDARKFNCHCGLAPFEYSSGSSVKSRTKTSHISNKSLKGILYKAAASAIQHDPQLKHYYNRKLKAGKEKLNALNAVANKIVLRIFAVQKRDEPFVKFLV